jgi:predicted pyridoxine 5'-phosphate oxidase superfamily flavin-nucleotide-binding protein
MYHAGARTLQDQFDSRRIADRLEQVQVHSTFTDHDRAFIEGCAMFFLATADADGHPDCSYKGGLPGFVRVVDERTLAFPDYDGNGMFKSLGNILLNPHVGLLFLSFERPRRLRVNGVATVNQDDPLMAEYPGAQLVVRVQAQRIFPNCPRYIHQLQLVEHSVYVPQPAYRPPIPEWKTMKVFRGALPRRASTDAQQGLFQGVKDRARCYAQRKVVRLRKELTWYLRRLENWLG